jgi:nicotinate-nucleotide pyrophosphorylase (carboxylating)
MNTPIPIPSDLIDQVDRALAEDIGNGDVTAALIPPDRAGRASVITREAAILCGVPYVNATFQRLDPAIRVEWQADEGDAVTANQPLFTVSGPARALLTGERTALNFLQLLCATATAAHAYAVLIADTACRVLDTRKTLPGLRTAQKYAVRVGGGQNHRIGLYDMVLIKENHIIAAGSIAKAVASARASSAIVPVEVEVENLDELREAIDAGVDIAMLDEFSLDAMREAVTINRAATRPVKLEASGSVTQQTIHDIALTGVDYVSVGSITKHVRAVDLSMRFEWAASP